MGQFTVILIAVFLFIIFILIARELFTWYTKRNQQIENQLEIIRLLKKQVGERQELNTLFKNFVRLRDKETDDVFDIHKSKWKKEKKKGNPERYEVLKEN